MKRPLVLGKVKQRLYLLHIIKPHQVKSIAGFNHSNRVTSSSLFKKIVRNYLSNSSLFLGAIIPSVSLQHNRLGHILFSNMINIPFIFYSNSSPDILPCDVCA